MPFDYEGAKKAGYTDEEIHEYVAKNNPKFDVEGAKKAGYSLEEINQHLSTQSSKKEENAKPEYSLPEKATRLVTQGTIGAIQAATTAYDIPAIISRKIGIANAPVELRKSIFEDIHTLLDKKRKGEWSPEHQKEYDTLVELIKDPEKMEKFLPKDEDVPHFDVGSLIEKGAKQFGVDLTPQGTEELAARWIGFIKNPAKAQELLKNGFNPQNAKEVLKALAPTGKEVLRGAGAGAAIQYAAEAELGPIGTMASALIGDIAPSLALKGASGAVNAVKNAPKSIPEAKAAVKKAGAQIAAKGTALFTSKDKLNLQKEIIKDFKEAGIQADAGTLTGNNLVKWVQSTLHQSGLTGGPLEEFKKTLTDSIVSEYKNMAEGVGQLTHGSRYEAGQALKSGLKEARDLDLSQSRELYNSARESAGDVQVYAGNVGSLIKEIENNLLPGAFKSAEQQKVIGILDKIKTDVEATSGTPKSASINSLINDKIALNDSINYEVQGGAKQLLKQVVAEIDKAITHYGESDPAFAKKWKEANEKFSSHAKVYRGKTISEALKTEDPSLIFSKMNTPHGIEEIRKGLSKTPEGRKLFQELSRYKLEEMIGNNMVNSTTQQLNFGTFSKLLEKGQNRNIVKSLMGEEGLKKLERLQNASGRLAETAQKFLNTSRSGVHLKDLAIAGEVLSSASAIFSTPWPFMISAGGILAARSTAKLLADPEFLQLLEDALIEAEKGSQASLQKAGLRLAQKVKSLEQPGKAAIQVTPNESP